MPTTLAVRFPLGHYHATAWDRSVNEGDVEWPPSPWRLLRALIATWHTRWPELSTQDIDQVLAALAPAPAYRTPPTTAGHTRHYLPDDNHTTAGSANTDLTLDPYRRLLSRDAELLIRWPVDLPPAARSILAKLVERLPYLGRADSVCDARLLDIDPPLDGTWWRPAAPGDTPDTRLLAPQPPIDRSLLEATTVQVRRARRTLPTGTTWISYVAPHHTVPVPAAPADRRTIQAIRFAVETTAPFRAQNGVLLADAVHHWLARQHTLDHDLVLGRAGAATDHQHAHLIPIADHTDTIHSLVVWVPGGLTARETVDIITITSKDQLSRHAYPGGEPVRGFPPTRLLLQAAGAVADVAPELCGPSTVWRSRTPYLPVRHRKRRESVADFLATDLRHELAHRRQPAPATVAALDPGDRLTDRWALGFRRYRLRENMGHAHVGLGIQVELTDPIAGPLLLGRLSHFGLGSFLPDREGTGAT